MMKKVLFVVAILSVIACKENKEAQVKVPPTQEKNVAVTNTGKDINITSQKEVAVLNDSISNEIYKEYLHLKSTLVNTNGAEAQKAATSFIATAMASKNKKLVGGLKRIAATDDVKRQREVFAEVSSEVEALVTSNIKSGKVYKQYCPMAFNGKGAYWLSDSKEVRNPYFGDKMLKCGTVEKEIE